MSDYLSLHQDAEGLVLRYLKNPTPDLKDLIMVQYASMVERIARKFLLKVAKKATIRIYKFSILLPPCSVFHKILIHWCLHPLLDI